MKEYMIEVIRRYWFFEDGTLEGLPAEEVREIYERLIDWCN